MYITTSVPLHHPQMHIAGLLHGLYKENRQWVNMFTTKPLPPDALVCRPCEKYIKWHTGEADVVPRWLPKEARLKPVKYCMVVGCGKVSHTSTSMVAHQMACERFDPAPITDKEAGSALLLCNSHYQHLYRDLHFPQPCAACSSQPKYGWGYIHRCPNPE